MTSKGKNKRKQLEYFDKIHNQSLSVDSIEEIDFLKWLDEAKRLSIINDYLYQPQSFELYKSETYIDVNGKSSSLFRDHVYSPDFLVTFDPNKTKNLAKEFKVHYSTLSTNECSVWIDTKGMFNIQARSFSTDRKWVWQKFKVYICEVVPQKFFKKFGCPKAAFLSEKTKKPRKMFLGMKSISQIFNCIATDNH